MTVASLDDLAFLTAQDPSGMLESVEGSAEQWRAGFAAARAMDLPPIDADAVCVCGMGGSGISGDVLAAIAATRSPIPVVVNKGFDLPAWVGDRTLVVCVSYSGDTEETVACAEDALHRKAQCVFVARGGALGTLADDAGVPRIAVEPGGLMPRAALPALASAVLAVGARAGAVPDMDTLVAEALDVVSDATQRWRSDAQTDRNVAKDLASAIAARTPAIWGQEGVLGVVAMRWKCQLNENAKMPASWAVVPEALHNEIVPAEDADTIVVLRSDIERDGVQRRIDALDLANAIEVRVPGTGDLAVFAAGALLGDLVSVYCAALRGVDPTPIEPIARLKRALG